MSVHSFIQLKMVSTNKAMAGKEKSNGKYEIILRAAIKVFAKNGFFNSKVADVAKEAGVADGTVYLYFKNKDDILVSIFNHVTEQALERGRLTLGEIEDPVEKLKRIVESHLEMYARDRDLAVVFQVELRSSTKFMEQFSATKVTDYLDVISSVIADGQKRGVFRKDLNTKLTAKILFGALDEMVTNWVLTQKRYSLLATAEPLIDIFLNGVARRSH